MGKRKEETDMGKFLSATIYKQDGTIIEKSYDQEPSLGDLQYLVGGYIERISCLKDGKICDMIINEEGRMYDYDVNKEATKLFVAWLDKEKRISPIRDVVGDVVVFNNFSLS